MPWPRISTPGTYPIEKCAQMFTKDMHTNVHGSTDFNSPKVWIVKCLFTAE